MKTAQVPDLLIEGKDVELIYHGLMHFIDSLEKYTSWVKDAPVPAKESALSSLRKDIEIYRKLQLKIYVVRMSKAVNFVDYE